MQTWSHLCSVFQKAEQQVLIDRKKSNPSSCTEPNCAGTGRAHLVSLRVLSRAAESSKPSARVPKARPRICLLWMGMYWLLFRLAKLIILTPQPARRRVKQIIEKQYRHRTGYSMPELQSVLKPVVGWIRKLFALLGKKCHKLFFNSNGNKAKSLRIPVSKSKLSTSATILVTRPAAL